jgi:CheY-like chemotaxis protein
MKPWEVGPAELPGASSTTKQKPVLVVDDDPDLREAIQRALEIEGYQVSLAANGREAWESLRCAPPPALILLDLMMPVMSGVEFLANLRADDRLRTLPVILMTAFGSTAATVVSQSQGYLPKPLGLDELLGVVSRYCPAKPA